MSARLYIAAAILAVVPIWCVRHLPTVDGPSHVYNSWILHELLRGSPEGPVSQWFAIDWRPHANWIGHAAMAALMFVVSPTNAEKVFLTGLVLLFLYGVWRFAGSPLAAFIGIPFAYNRLLQFGFYNFCFGAALYFVIIAVWWKRRDRPTARTIALIATLLLVCYFSHAMGVILAMGSIGLLWLMTLRGRRFAQHARHFLSFVPVLPLLWWFRATGGSYLDAEVKGSNLLRFLLRGEVLYAFDKTQLAVATCIVVVIAILAIVTIARRTWTWNERDAFIVLTAVLAVLYFLTAFVAADVRDRMGLFLSMSVLAWVDLRLTPPKEKTLTIAFAIITAAYLGFIISRYRVAGAYVHRYVQSADAIGEMSTFMPVLYEIGPPGCLAPVYYHAIDYVAIKKASVDIADYEPILGWFPIAWRPGVQPGNIDIAAPEHVNVGEIAQSAEYVFAWKMPPELRPRLAPSYTFVGESGGGSVFRRAAP